MKRRSDRATRLRREVVAIVGVLVLVCGAALAVAKAASAGAMEPPPAIGASPVAATSTDDPSTGSPTAPTTPAAGTTAAGTAAAGTTAAGTTAAGTTAAGTTAAGTTAAGTTAAGTTAAGTTAAGTTAAGTTAAGTTAAGTTAAGTTAPAPQNAGPAPPTATVATGGANSVQRPSAVPSTEPLTGAVEAFLGAALGALVPGEAAALPADPASCRCAISLALSLDGNADATAAAAPHPTGQAQPGASPLGDTAPGDTAPGDTALGDTALGDTALGDTALGDTGWATAVSMSGDGPAGAYAASGNVGGRSSVGSSAAMVSRSGVPGGVSGLPAATQTLISELLADNGAAATSVEDASLCATGCTGPVDVDIATGPRCGTAGCVVAVAIAVGGTATASVLSTRATAAAEVADTCTGGTPGAARAVAISASGTASASARMGAAPVCSTPGAGTAAGESEDSGRTGAALALGLTADGAASSSAVTGDSGQLGAAVGTGAASAATGSTGPAVGIAIARHGATALVQSGNSGGAGAGCTGCGGVAGPAGKNAVAVAVSGDTGASYSLAIAGMTASVRSASGDSGNSIAWTFLDGPVAGSGSGGLAQGHSGSTGNTVVIAVGLGTWVDVLTHSGRSGAVLSTATLGGPGCQYIVTQLTLSCPTTSPAAPPAGGTGARGGGSDATSTPPKSIVVPPSAPGVVRVHFGRPGTGVTQRPHTGTADAEPQPPIVAEGLTSNLGPATADRRATAGGPANSAAPNLLVGAQPASSSRRRPAPATSAAAMSRPEHSPPAWVELGAVVVGLVLGAACFALRATRRARTRSAGEHRM